MAQDPIITSIKKGATEGGDQSFWDTMGSKISDGAWTWGPKILFALVTLLIGLWIIRRVVKMVSKVMENKAVDSTLRPFLIALTAVGLKVLLFLAVAGQIGIQTTSFIAIVGAAGLAIGLAFQGGLGNLAGGVLLLVFRPFKVGDVIEAQGEIGTVQEISVFVTFLLTPQNKTAIIPNGPLAGGNIVNYTSKGNIRADIDFAIRYEEDHDRAIEVVKEVLAKHPKVLQDPAPNAMVVEFGESALKLKALPYTTTGDFWDVKWGLPGEIKKALGAAGFSPAYPTEIEIKQTK